MAEEHVQGGLTPPKFEFKDRVYRFNTELTLAQMDVLSELIHSSRAAIRDMFLSEMKAESPSGKIDPNRLMTFTVNTYDVWHEISRTGNSARFVAACVADSEKEINQLSRDFETLPAAVYDEVFDFFCNGGTLLNLIFPSSSGLVALGENTTQPAK